MIWVIHHFCCSFWGKKLCEIFETVILQPIGTLMSCLEKFFKNNTTRDGTDSQIWKYWTVLISNKLIPIKWITWIRRFYKFFWYWDNSWKDMNTTILPILTILEVFLENLVRYKNKRRTLKSNFVALNLSQNFWIKQFFGKWCPQKSTLLKWSKFSIQSVIKSLIFFGVHIWQKILDPKRYESLITVKWGVLFVHLFWEFGFWNLHAWTTGHFNFGKTIILKESEIWFKFISHSVN